MLVPRAASRPDRWQACPSIPRPLPWCLPPGTASRRTPDPDTPAQLASRGQPHSGLVKGGMREQLVSSTPSVGHGKWKGLNLVIMACAIYMASCIPGVLELAQGIWYKDMSKTSCTWYAT